MRPDFLINKRINIRGQTDEKLSDWAEYRTPYPDPLYNILGGAQYIYYQNTMTKDSDTCRE